MLVEDASRRRYRDRDPTGCAIRFRKAPFISRWARTVSAQSGRWPRRTHDAGQILVAAPVLGRPDLAASGSARHRGGRSRTTRFAPALPCCSLMGRRRSTPGTLPESATAIKLANNMLLGCAMVAMAEGFSLVRGYDVAPATFYDVHRARTLFRTRPPTRATARRWWTRAGIRSGSPVTVGLKDANLIVAAADIARVPMPSLNVYRDRLLGAVAHGDGDRDQAVLAREQARAAGRRSASGARPVHDVREWRRGATGRARAEPPAPSSACHRRF